MIKIKNKIIDILHKVMDLQNDIRLTRFLIEFNKGDSEMMKTPATSGPELCYLESVLNGDPFDNNEEAKVRCDDRVINWMKASFNNKNLDMRHKSTQRDLICVLLDIILYQDSTMVNRAFTLLVRYFTQKTSIIKYANEVQLL